MVTLPDIFNTQFWAPNSPNQNAIQALAQAYMSKSPVGEAFLQQGVKQQLQQVQNNPNLTQVEKNQAIQAIVPPTTPTQFSMASDPFGGMFAYNPYNPGQQMQLGSGGPFSSQPQQGGTGAVPAPGTTPAAGGANPLTVPSLTGNDFLQSIPPQTAQQVKALAEGRMQFPAGFALKSPYWQQMIAAVSKYDPTFDAVNYNARANTVKDFKSGKSADNITALNTAIQHLGQLAQNFGALNNGDYHWLNTAMNKVESAGGSTKMQTAMQKVGADATAVSHELAKVFRQTGMSEGEIREWEKKINTSNTPAENKAVIDEALDLMNGRLQSLASRYNQGMGTTKDGIDLLSPQASQTLSRLQSGIDQSTTHPMGGMPSKAGAQYNLTTPSGIKYRVVK